MCVRAWRLRRGGAAGRQRAHENRALQLEQLSSRKEGRAAPFFALPHGGLGGGGSAYKAAAADCPRPVHIARRTHSLPAKRSTPPLHTPLLTQRRSSLALHPPLPSALASCTCLASSTSTMARSSAVLLVVAVLALAAAQGALAGGRGFQGSNRATSGTICDSLVTIFVPEPTPGTYTQ